MGRRVSHISPGFSISFPDAGARRGESEKRLSPRCAHCHLAVSADGKGGRRIKGTNYTPPTPLSPYTHTHVWTGVKLGQSGNFSVISTASTLFSVKGDVQRGLACDVTPPARTDPEGWQIPLSAAPLISLMVTGGGGDWLHSRLVRPPWGGQGYPSQEEKKI